MDDSARLTTLHMLASNIIEKYDTDLNIDKPKVAIEIFRDYCEVVGYKLMDTTKWKGFKKVPVVKLLTHSGEYYASVNAQTLELMDEEGLNNFDIYLLKALTAFSSDLKKPYIHDGNEHYVKTSTLILLALGYDINNIRGGSRQNRIYISEVAFSQGLEHTNVGHTGVAGSVIDMAVTAYRYTIAFLIVIAGILGIFWLLSL